MDDRKFKEIMYFLGLGIAKSLYDYLLGKAEEICKENGYRTRNSYDEKSDVF